MNGYFGYPISENKSSDNRNNYFWNDEFNHDCDKDEENNEDEFDF